MYEDVYNMTAVCQDEHKNLVTYPLKEIEGEEMLCYERVSGQWERSSVPSSLLTVWKRPACKKKPAAAATAAEPPKKKRKAKNDSDDTGEDDQAEAGGDDTGDDDQTEEGGDDTRDDDQAREEGVGDDTRDDDQAREEGVDDDTRDDDQGGKAKAKKVRLTGKQGVEEVDGIYLVQAKKGQIRSYALARMGKAKKHLVEVSEKASRNHHQIMKQICDEMEAKVKHGVDYSTLRDWARTQKQRLLSG